MKFQIGCTSGKIEEYINKLNKYNLKSEKRYEKDIFGGRKLVEYTDYFIELNTLTDLINFNKDIDCEIIFNGYGIEIYDDYRE